MRLAPSIDLLVPGLLGPMPALREIDIAPKAPVLEKCLSRARVSETPAKDYSSTLFHLFGLDDGRSSDLPTAPFCRLADSSQQDAAYWLQAAPVHLRPDGDGLLLFDASVLEISLDEANQLAETIRNHFGDMGWQLEVYSPQRWYLRLETQPDIETFLLSDVTGRNIDSFLPKGKDATSWHSILNELQMLLHMAPVNMLREGKGQLTINGIWLHGGGRFQPIENTAYASLSADEPLARGMAQAAGIELVALPQDSADLVPDSEKRLVVTNMLERPVLDADPYGWVEALEKFDAWLEPLLGAVRPKNLDSINIYPCNGSVFRIDSGSFRRFWRRRQPLGYYLPS